MGDIFGGGSSGGGVNIPTAGQDLSSVLKVLSKQSGRISDLQSQEVSGRLGRLAEFGPEARALEAEQARADFDLISSFAPQIREIFEQRLTPEAQEIQQVLGGQLLSELQLGAQVDPELARELQQGVRAGQTARGITFGAAPVAEEALVRGSAAQNLRRSRQSAAQAFLQFQNQSQVNPFAIGGSFLGRTPQGLQEGGLQSSLIPGLLQTTGQRSLAQFNADQAQQAGGFTGLAGTLGPSVIDLF